MSGIDDSSGFCWATSISRTRLSSVASFVLEDPIDTRAISDLHGILQVIRELQIPQIPQRELRALERIGEGVTFSVVKYLWADRVVALKYIKYPEEDGSNARSSLRSRLKSILQEIMVMHHKPLAAHPHVVGILGYGWQQIHCRPSPFIAVEYGSLGTLRQFLSAGTPQNLRSKLILAGDVAAGLIALHQAGVAHGDLKLDNVICFRSNYRPITCQAKLCDFSHSVSTIGEPKSVYYSGTLRYLPPEALQQHEIPICSTMIHKCDIWAYGLALWEILIDGKVYFEASWMHDPQYSLPNRSVQSRGGSMSLPSTEITAGTESWSDLEPGSSQRSRVFGDFDIAHLRTLAQMAVDRVAHAATSDSVGFARSYLRPLMRMTLDPDPATRFSHIDRSPVITSWQADSRRSALESKLAFHTSSPHLTSDIFCPDRQAEIAWSTQTYIHDDIGAIIRDVNQNSFSRQAFLQFALCKAGGFGCDIDITNAVMYLNIGLEHDLLSSFVGKELEAGLTDNMKLRMQPFSDRLAAIFSCQWLLDRQSAVSLVELLSYDARLNNDAMESIPLGAITNLSQLLFEAETLSGSNSAAVLSQSLIRFEKERVALSWLDIAILWNDDAFINSHKDVLFAEHLNRTNSWTHSPLLLACAKGKTSIVLQLLKAGADPGLTTPGGCNLLHFLFCLKDQAVDVLNEIVARYRDIFSKIDLPCEKAFRLHTQWPTEIKGSPLAIAVTAGHHSLTHALLGYGANPRSPAFAVAEHDRYYVWTPMHLAIKYNFTNIVADFMQWYKGGEGFSGAHCEKHFPLAVSLAFLTAFERYGIHGHSSKEALRTTVSLIPREDLFSSNAEGATAILKAVDFENYQVVCALLECEPLLAVTKVINPADANDFTFPLHFACQICSRRDSRDCLRIPAKILEVHQGTLQDKDHIGRSVLHFAVASEYPLVAEWLLDKGMHVDSCDNLNRSALMLSQSLRNSNALLRRGASVLLEDQWGHNAASYAIKRDDHKTLQFLLESGINANSRSKTKRSLLHTAVSTSSLECTKILCQTGVSLDTIDEDGYTALHLAMSTTPEIVRVLIQKGATITVSDHAGRTAPQTIVSRLREQGDQLPSDGKLFRSLVEPLCGAPDVEQRNEEALSYILYACSKYGNAVSVASFLGCLSLGTRFTINTLWRGNHALHAAASVANVDVARELFKRLEGGLDAMAFVANIRDSSDRTAMTLLSMVNDRCEDVAQFHDLLMRKGAKDLQDEKGKTVWTLAQQCNSFQMLTCILLRGPLEERIAMLKDHPLTQEQLVRSAEANFLDLISAFSRLVVHMPEEFETNFLKRLANSLSCPTSWSDVGRVLESFCVRRSCQELVLNLLRGETTDLPFENSSAESWELRSRLLHDKTGLPIDPERRRLLASLSTVI